MDDRTRELEYARMLEIPVNSCNVVVKKNRRKKKRPEADALKQQVVDRVNARLAAAPDETAALAAPEEPIPTPAPEAAEAETAEFAPAALPGFPSAEEEERERAALPAERSGEKRGEKAAAGVRAFFGKFRRGGQKAGDGAQKRKVSVVAIEVGAAAALVAVIFLTNVFLPTSGINTVIRSVFRTKEPEPAADLREYREFSAGSPLREGEVRIDDGVMTFSGRGTLYAPCDGVVGRIVEEAGKYVMEIEHSRKFKTVISGVDYAYYSVGDSVYGALPVAYLGEGTATVALYNDGVLLENYLIDGGNIVWQS